MNTEKFKFAILTQIAMNYNLKNRQLIESNLENFSEEKMTDKGSKYQIRVSYVDDQDWKVELGIISTHKDNMSETEYLELFEDILDMELYKVLPKHEVYSISRKASDILKIEL